MFKKKVLDLQGPPKKRSVFQKMFDRTCVHFILHERWFRFIPRPQPHYVFQRFWLWLVSFPFILALGPSFALILALGPSFVFILAF